MRRIRLAAGLFLAFAFLFLSTGGAHAQWVFVARKVIGRVESMTQSQQKSDTPRYDVATVMLEADPDKVYQTVLATVATHKDYKTRPAQRCDPQHRGHQRQAERRRACGGASGQACPARHRLGHSAQRPIADIFCRGEYPAHLRRDEGGLYGRGAATPIEAAAEGIYRQALPGGASRISSRSLKPRKPCRVMVSARLSLRR